MPTTTHRCTEGCHYFRLMAWTWCTTYAQQLIDTDPTVIAQAEPCDIVSADALLGLNREPDARTISLIDYSRDLNKDYAKGVDLTKPIIIVQFDEVIWIIDGWHRVWRARSEGLTHLPAVLLTEEASRRTVVQGPPLPRPYLPLAETDESVTFDAGDVCEEQAGKAWGRRFAARIDDETWAVVDVVFFADKRDEDGTPRSRPKQITCETSWTTCTDPARPGETELLSDVRYATATTQGRLTSAVAREMCELFDPAWIRWEPDAIAGVVTHY